MVFLIRETHNHCGVHEERNSCKLASIRRSGVEDVRANFGWLDASKEAHMFSTLRHTLFVLILAPNRRHIRKYEGDMHSGLLFFFAFWKGACRLVLEHDGTWGSRIIGCWDSIPTSSANRVAFNQPYFARDFSLPSLGFSNLRQKRARRLTQIPSVFIMHAWIGRSDRRLSAIS